MEESKIEECEWRNGINVYDDDGNVMAKCE